MLRQFLFRDQASALAYSEALGDYALAGSRRNYSGIPMSVFESGALSYGGIPYYSSSASGKELHAYQYAAAIHDQDREYLHQRDPLTYAINTVPPRDSWFRVPITGVDAIDSMFRELRKRGFNSRAMAADSCQRKYGYAFLYVNAAGGSDQPITNRRVWSGFDYVRARDIVWADTTYKDDDPLLPWHIEKLAVRDANGKTFFIHGTRLVPFVEDHEARHPSRARAKIDPVFDAIWNIRDVEYMQKQAQFEGSPYALEVDSAAQFRLTPERAAEMGEEMTQVRGLGRDGFGPLEGVKVKRVGAMDLDNAEWAMRILVGRVAVATEFTSNMLIALSRGSEQITDSDRVDYASNIRIRGESFMWPILARVVDLAKEANLLVRRPEFPDDLEWPELRILTAKEFSSMQRNQAMAIQAAAAGGRMPPDNIRRHWPVDPNAIVPPEPQGDGEEPPEMRRDAFEEDAAA